MTNAQPFLDTVLSGREKLLGESLVCPDPPPLDCDGYFLLFRR